MTDGLNLINYIVLSTKTVAAYESVIRVRYRWVKSNKVYGLIISDDCSSSFFAFSCDMKNAKLFCMRPVRNETSRGPGSPSPTCSATAKESLAWSGRLVSRK